jgi:oxaloacetate decarboxylase (Na+ extruding) subunit alpha
MAKGKSKRKSGSGSGGSGALKRHGPEADNSGNDVGSSGFELSELRRLIRLVQRTGIGELEISSGGRTVRISARGEGSYAVAPMAAPGPAVETSAPPASPKAADTDRLKAVTSPMVGTFYRAPAPDADPYVEVGATVDVGQTVCIVEAMKLMNEIESDVKGRIVQILVENAQPVEFGQKLFLVDPS